MAKVDAVTWRFAGMRWDYGCGEWVEDNDISNARENAGG
jgi:hypothetical protein